MIDTLDALTKIAPLFFAIATPIGLLGVALYRLLRFLLPRPSAPNAPRARRTPIASIGIIN